MTNTAGNILLLSLARLGRSKLNSDTFYKAYVALLHFGKTHCKILQHVTKYWKKSLYSAL